MSDLNDVNIVMIYHHGLCRKEPLRTDSVVRGTTGVDFIVLEDISVYEGSIYIRMNISGSRCNA